MKHLSSIISYAIATVGLLLMFNSTPKVSSQQNLNQPFTQPTNNNEGATNNHNNIPKRLTISVKVAEPTDLKIKENDLVKEGQIIADRTKEKERLESQSNQLKLALEKLENSLITAPLPPNKVPTISALPPISYLEEEANVDSKKVAITAVESEMKLKQQEIDYLSQIDNIDALILEHENAKLEQLKQKQTQAIREYQLASAKLQTAKENRAYDEHQNQVQQSNRIEQINQANLNYQRQLAEYEQRLANKEYQITQLKTQINQIENQIASVATVKSPYTGTVRRIQWLGQAPDGSLSAEITLMVSNSN